MPQLIRPGATRATTYNDGLVVYLYDVKHREALREGGATRLVETALDGIGGEKDKAVLALAKQERLVAYQLPQDDTVSVDVVVGAPLTPAELKAVKGVKWHPAQTAVIDLPSGELAVESANSCAFDAEEGPPSDPGAEVKVPPGRYLLTLHRRSYGEMEDAVVEGLAKADAAHEVVVLTPIEEAKKVPKKWPLALPVPGAGPSLSWVGKYEIKDGTFTGLISFWGFWEMAWLNLDRKAFDALGLGSGSVLDLETGGRRFTLVYFNDSIKVGLGQLGAYKLLLQGDRTLAPVAGEPELLLATFTKQEGTGVEALACMRIAAKEMAPKAWHDKWRKVVATVRPGRLPNADAAALGNWKKAGKALAGEVLFRAGRYLYLNFDPAALEALGAKPGDELVLGIGGEEHRLALFADLDALKPELTKYRAWGETPEELEKLTEKYLGADEKKRGELRRQILDFLLRDRPLLAMPDAHWLEPDRIVLLVQAPAMDWDLVDLKIELPIAAKPGDKATLRKA